MAQQHGRKPAVLTITPAEAAALMPHVEQAFRALRCLASMHAAARLSGRAKEARTAGRKLAAFQQRLQTFTAGPSEGRGSSRNGPGDRPGRAGRAIDASREPLIQPTVATGGTA